MENNEEEKEDKSCCHCLMTQKNSHINSVYTLQYFKSKLAIGTDIVAAWFKLLSATPASHKSTSSSPGCSVPVQLVANVLGSIHDHPTPWPSAIRGDPDEVPDLTLAWPIAFITAI